MSPHWENVYSTKAADQVSWYRPHLETSLAMIERAAGDLSASIVDVGGGASTLVDDLLSRGYENLAVLDISSTALAIAKKRLGDRASKVQWIQADITQPLPDPGPFEVWHDRAVFHFLNTLEARQRYLRNVTGHIVISVFGPNGPMKCSGLEISRYSVEDLCREFGDRFQLVESATESHETPFGTTQEFVSCSLRPVISRAPRLNVK